jgi:3-dehydrotetronate 4-kinase
MLLGVIADDLTGATDVALMLSREGMRVVQTVGVPEKGKPLPDADAVVVSMKSRTNPVDEAIAWSLQACEALLQSGAKQILFKYCSTFDSTDQGNIGPVADALMKRLDSRLTIACPAFPENGRSVYLGHLFVGEMLLSDSPMKDHPLTPMRDSNLVRVLQRQTLTPVKLVTQQTVAKGVAAVRQTMQGLSEKGPVMVVADAISNQDLRILGEAMADEVLLTGGSGIALGLPDNFRRAGLLKDVKGTTTFVAPKGPSVILSGSCSAATNGQVAYAQAHGVPSLGLDPLAIAEKTQTVETVIDWAHAQIGEKPFLIYSTAAPEAVKQIQERLGRDQSGHLIEALLAGVAHRLAQLGVCRFVVAGGETSGAVVQGLGVSMLEIGPEIDPGVPWTLAADGRPLALALKSGNFGTQDFFVKALAML